MRENCLRLFGHVQIRSIDATMLRTNCLEVICTSRERGLPKKLG